MKKIAIHSVPRSGSTWLSSIFDSHPKVNFKFQPLFSYAFKAYLNEDSSLTDIENFFKEIFYSSDDFINQKEGIDKGLIPKFDKIYPLQFCCYKEVRYHNILQNMLSQCMDVKAILLIRNPLAVLSSWWSAPKEFRKDQGWDFNEEWKYALLKNQNRPEEFNGYLKWKEATMLYLDLKKMYPKQVYLIKYSDLIKSPFRQVEDVFEFCNLNMHPQTLKFLKDSQNINHEDAYSVFKIKETDTKWKTNLPEKVVDYIYNDLLGNELEIFLDV